VRIKYICSCIFWIAYRHGLRGVAMIDHFWGKRSVACLVCLSVPVLDGHFKGATSTETDPESERNYALQVISA